jgi:RNA polymerase sigma-70 factor, ECF subfamily
VEHALTSPQAVTRPAADAAHSFDWGAFFDAHGAFIYAAVRRFGGPSIDAEDATQDVMMVVLRQHARFEGRSALRTWLYRICINVASEHRRKHRRRATFESVLEAVAFWRHKDPSPRLEARNALGRVQQLLAKVSEKYRQVLILCELEGLPTAEVARVLELPESTVRARLHYARKEILALIAAEGGQEP